MDKRITEKEGYKNSAIWFLCISLFALLVRVAVSLHPYSGAGNPPKYGDFEAQRHWMEITLGLPPKEWYRNSTINDLSYWGLDYPPLTAYQSYVHGLLLRYFHPDSVSLYTSCGHESYLGKLLMRWTVLLSDALIFFPAVLCFVIAYYFGQQSTSKNYIAWHTTIILLSPCLILSDHGHFQYNCISLGLTVGAIAAIISGKELVGSSLALNHKQMSAYFAPAFFSHLFGKCLRRRNPHFEVLSRLAPFERGIYEDYVANFWCTTSIIIKWKRLFTTQSLKLLSLSATLLTCLPSMIQQIRYPSRHGFLYSLLNSAFSFYFFSFQVHEKSILLPLLPASLLALEEPSIFQWLIQFALLSMFPLLCRDKLVVPYVALYGIFILLYNAPGWKQDTRKKNASPIVKSLLVAVITMVSFLLHVIYLTISPPMKYPFLFEAIIMLLCFSQFIAVAVYTNRKQWMLSKQHCAPVAKEKHL